MPFSTRRSSSLLRTSVAALCALALASSGSALGAVVRQSPDFTFPGPGNRAKSLRSLRGQPVVVLIADSPNSGAYRKQLKELREIYSQFASRQVVFLAVFKNGSTAPVQSNVPFAVADNGAAVAGAYGVLDDFSLVIIGKDGNIDYQTNRATPAQRIRDVIQNSFVIQETARKSYIR